MTKRTGLALATVFLLAACGGKKPDSVYVVNHSKTPVYVSACSNKGDKNKIICSGWSRLGMDDIFRKAGYGSQKLYVYVSQHGSSLNFSGQYEHRNFMVRRDDFEVKATTYADMVKIKSHPHIFGWNVENNIRPSQQTYPVGWESLKYTRATNGQTSLRITP